ncbi:MAG: hypothetical protein Q8Q63_10875 [Phaeovulum sp.]|uniref:hypothetical protein n=1 Tax=Phaeovulum sp. TaxID=2934796 RepID=UPI00272F1E70|nr:hypothetical protein [Phaeovulum sp.]MDP2064155.1 hypothetical protein [Phaeovulum sp.]MDP3862072.1 hypothetical protein [Phaeovulum sp.]
MAFRSVLLLLAGIACGLAGLAPRAALAQDVDGRLIYQLEVTQPGTRSQGWLGTLYDDAGRAIATAPGTIVETRVGAFENLPCTHLWSQCGFLRVGMLPVTAMSGFAALTENQAWVYRLYIHGEGSRSEGLTGVLLQEGLRIFADVGRRVETPLGVFLAVDNGGKLWGNAGWFPETWN